MAKDSPLLGKTTGVASECGWWWQHQQPTGSAGRWRTSVTGKVGVPDLILTHPKHGVLFLEVKGPGGYPSMAQLSWLRRLPRSFVVRPVDVALVEQALRSGNVHVLRDATLCWYAGRWWGKLDGWASKQTFE